MDIEVKVAGRGVVRGDSATADADTKALCSICNLESDVVVSVPANGASVDVCTQCLRTRLDAMSVARYRLRGPATGIPWGKVAG